MAYTTVNMFRDSEPSGGGQYRDEYERLRIYPLICGSNLLFRDRHRWLLHRRKLVVGQKSKWKRCRIDGRKCDRRASTGNVVFIEYPKHLRKARRGNNAPHSKVQAVMKRNIACAMHGNIRNEAAGCTYCCKSPF